MGRRYNWEKVNGVWCCIPMLVPPDPCYPSHFVFRKTGDPDVDALILKATDDLNQITDALEEQVGTDQRTVRFLLFENPETGDDELALAVVNRCP